MISKNKQEIEELLTRGVEKIYPSTDFLRSRLLSGKKLTIFHGIDPTGPDLHLGHAIPLMKMAEFQQLGHKIILLIGDFTAMIGDPTDKLSVRSRLTKAQVLANAKKYKKQASKIFDFTGANKVEMKYNSKWLAKMTLEDAIDLMAHTTLQQMSQRDMFQQRTKEGKAVFGHEFIYPLLQGYDSVAMDVDGEVGGTDQTFNMLVGRDLLKGMKNKEKFVVTTKLLVDPTGKKMGKTESNMVRLSDSAQEMFGKIMSWTDEMIVPGFDLLTRLPIDQVKQMAQAMKKGANPRDYKAQLANDIVSFFHGDKAALKAAKDFGSVFKKHELPKDIPELKIKKGTNIVEALVKSKLASSNSDARRLIKGRGVKVDGQLVDDPEQLVSANQVVQKGKRHFIKLCT